MSPKIKLFMRIRIVLGRAMDLISLKKAYGIILFYSLAVLISRLQVGVIWAGDTQQYIEKSVIRSPIYPLIIDFFKYLFRPYEFIALICFQLIFVLFAAFYLSHLLWKKFNLHPITFILLNIFLSVPLLSCSVAVGIHGKIGNHILTEAITYGLLLFVISFLVETIFTDERRDFIIILLLIATLTLIRTPMIYLYAIVASLIWHRYWRYRDISLLAGFVVLTISIVLIADFGERFYHKTVNNYFGKISRSASHMLVGAVYISDKHALSLIENTDDREVLRRTYDHLENRKLLAKQRYEIKRRLVDVYDDNFCYIQTTIEISFQEVFSLQRGEDRMYLEYEDFSQRLVPILVRHYYMDFSKLMLLKFLYTLNFREGFFIASFLLFPFVKFSRELKIFAIFVLLMLVANRIMMTPIIFMNERYLFYSDILEYVILIIMAEQYLKSCKCHRVPVPSQT